MNKKLFHALFVATIISLTAISTFSQQAPQKLPPPPIPKRISGGVVNGKALSLPKPIYPAAARAANIEGSVSVTVVIAKNGLIMSAKATSGHPLLRNSAFQAAKQAQFRPTLLRGQPVEVSGVIVYSFVVPKKDDEAKLLATTATINTDDNLNEGSLSKDDDKTITFMLSMILSAHEYIGNDKEFDGIIVEMISIIPQFQDYSEEFEGFQNKSLNEKKRLVNKLQNLLQKDLKTNEKWQFQIGELIGKLMGQFGKQETNINTINKEDLQVLLTKIGDLIFSAPEDFPKPLLKELQRVSKYADNKNLGSKKTQLEIFKIIEKGL